VRRQCDALHAAGWRVYAAGLGQTESGIAWTLLAAPSRQAPPGRNAAAALLRRVCDAALLLRVRLQPSYALRFTWRRRPGTRTVYEAARDIAADVWIANDWPALPVAARLAEERGGIVVYDSHEFAVEEFAESPRWRFWHRPLARAVEERFIRHAAAVSVVSDGIADRLQNLYGLAERPRVIRNTPPYQEVPFRPTGTRVAVLYHGIVAPGRGLETCIDSVALWRPEFTLTIRGSGNAAYLAALQNRIGDLGLADRIELVPAVPPAALIAAAAAFDIGLFALPGHSLHNEYALPNKFFEYGMAGLALCVSDLPEMARLLRRYDLGHTIPAVTPAAIAAAINAFDAAAIDRCKRNSLAAARTLNWEQEAVALTGSLASLLPEIGFRQAPEERR
jgi:glycosyltransferase involved in cell wall biosynthesis